MNPGGQLNRTPLYRLYQRYGGRTIPFGGWEMPVQFSGIIDEHQAVRTSAGLFDISHMGEIWIEGPEAFAAVQYLTVNDASKLKPGMVQYSALPNAEGGLVDDITVYCFAPDRFMLCVNAANIAKDFRWVKVNLERFPGAKAEDRSAETALLALQGPKAQDILRRLTYVNLDSLAFYHFATGRVSGTPAVISRTGYTGEDGFEVFIDAQSGPDLWEEIMTFGEAVGLKPCGLGARDTLRLEMGYALYGEDIDETTNPLEAGLGWITKLQKGDFIGREAIIRLKQEGIRNRLAAFMITENGVPRHGYSILFKGQTVGKVTSGNMSPSLRVGVGLGYVTSEAAVPGTELSIKIRDKEVPAKVVKPPFYTSGSARTPAAGHKEA